MVSALVWHWIHSSSCVMGLRQIQQSTQKQLIGKRCTRSSSVVTDTGSNDVNHVRYANLQQRFDVKLPWWWIQTAQREESVHEKIQFLNYCRMQNWVAGNTSALRSFQWPITLWKKIFPLVVINKPLNSFIISCPQPCSGHTSSNLS